MAKRKHMKTKSIGAIFSTALSLFVFGTIGVNGAFAAATVNQSLLPTLNNGVFNVTVTQANVDACIAAGGTRFSYFASQDGATVQLLQSFIFPLSDLNLSYPLTSSAANFSVYCSNVGNALLSRLAIVKPFSLNSDFASTHPLLFSDTLPIITEPSWPTLNSGTFDVTVEQSDVNTCVAAGGTRFSYFATQDGVTLQLLQSFPLGSLNFSSPLTSPAPAWYFICSNANNDVLVPLAYIETTVQFTGGALQPLLFHPYIAPTTGTPEVGSILTAGALTPAEATVTYNWRISDTADGVYTDTSPASTTNTYIPSASELGKYLKVVVTGTGNYSGISTSTATTVITTPVTGVAISGTPTVGGTLTAGSITPSGATGTYRWWSSSDTITYASLSSTTANYIPQASDAGKYLKVDITGTSPYTGTATSTATTVIAGKQLTISDPSLTLSKIYDGNTDATVTAGTLSGVIDGDEVTVTAAANYDSASGGVNKTITVAYTLGGAQASGYIKPVNYSVSNGVIDSGGSVPVSFLTPPANIPAVPPLPANPTQTDLQNLINFLLQKIEALRAQLPPEQAAPLSFPRALHYSMQGDDVLLLQKTLNALGYLVASLGNGSPGKETNYYGTKTQIAVRKFQCKAMNICSGNYSTTGYGRFGNLTKAKLMEAWDLR